MRWLTDWRLVATWAATAAAGFLLAIMVVTMVDSSTRAHRAIQAAQEASAASEQIASDSQQRTETVRRRIDLLNGRIEDLTEDLNSSHATVARLEAQIEALSGQLSELDVEPVVVTRSQSSQANRQTSPERDTGQDAEPPDPCERRNPQGKCTDADPKGKGDSQ